MSLKLLAGRQISAKILKKPWAESANHVADSGQQTETYLYQSENRCTRLILIR